MSRRPTRRAAGAFLAGAAAWLSGGASPAAASELPRRLLHAAFDDPARARALGVMCRKVLPRQSAMMLARAVIASLPAPSFKSRTAFRRALAQRMREDFAGGAVVAAQDWHLSLTEARLYALAAAEREEQA